jgi:hypothetical protein
MALGSGTANLGAANLSAANLSAWGLGRPWRRRGLGAALWRFAVHDQDVELVAAAANLQRDLAVDR